MAFSSKRGRPPRAPCGVPDHGTPELRRQRMLCATAEPIDLCLEKGLIDSEQHRCGLHLRWLHTLRYGAPSLTTRYVEKDAAASTQTCDEWRSAREQEYLIATRLLKAHRFEQPIMRLAVYNELPAFLSPTMQAQAWHLPALAERLDHLRAQVVDGLNLLVKHWLKSHNAGAT